MVHLFTFLLLTITLNAAGPMTHLFLGERYCEIYALGEENCSEFLVGTLYPDIRYIAHFPRNLTHPSIEDIEEVSYSASFFEQGIAFHAWVDSKREEFVIQSGIYEKIRPYADGHEATLLKFIEEEIIADYYDGRKWSFCFDTIYPREKKYAADETIQKWHTIIQYTMSYRPSWLLWGVSYIRENAFGISAATLNQWSFLLPQLSQDSAFQDYFCSLLAYLLEKMTPSQIVPNVRSSLSDEDTAF